MPILRSIVPAALIAVFSCSVASCSSTPGDHGPDEASRAVPADVVVAWNARVLEIAEAEDHFLTLKGVRAAAMTHLAIHDALNTIDARFDRYAYDGEIIDADPVAAAAQAAYEVAANQYPDRRDLLDEELTGWLGSVPEGPARSSGRALGRRCAAAVLEARAGDGWDAEGAYEWRPAAPGVYAPFHEHSGTPEGFVFGSGWGAARPFFLPQPDHFRAPPPPPIESAAYADAYDEVKSLGRFESSVRSEDQTHCALWWKDFAENSHNRLARQLVRDEGLELWQAARTFALLNACVFDAYVSVFDNKFFYNHWRPYTAIRSARDDGNPRTAPDPSWDNTHRHTYAFPSYPSAHGAASAAAMSVLAGTFGADYPFTMVTREVDSAGPMSAPTAMDPPVRSFESFAAAATECGLSRVYLGIHFRYDATEGVRLGERVGEFAQSAFLEPRQNPPSRRR